ncbi:DUF2917 domain-containing protein [Bdellovibrio sp. 22V]|uniref:DUF2917 domain-containing protein n=1 Tax=Bdellovibrio sp. 22V TaxID=3044166 RepID=UPI0032EADBF6
MGDSNHIHLSKGDLYTQSSQNVKVRCFRGCLWLTQPGEGSDIILHAGDTYISDVKKGKLVIEAIHESLAEVQTIKCEKRSTRWRELFSTRLWAQSIFFPSYRKDRK